MTTLVFTHHARQVIADKGFDLDAVTRVHECPTRVTDVLAHPGQIRLIGDGLALVGCVQEDRFVLITVYEDGVLTPPRPDQLETEAGRVYAARYEAGLGRGSN